MAHLGFINDNFFRTLHLDNNAIPDENYNMLLREDSP